MTAFVTTSELGSKLGVDASTAKGTLCVNGACGIISYVTGQDIAAGTTTVALDGTGTDALPLPQRPVTAATTVVESGGTLVLDTDYKLGDNGILYRLPGVIDNGWGTAELRTYWWPGRQNIEVTYAHGYEDADVPDAIRAVALELAARLFTQTPGVVFEQLGQRQIRWDRASSELTGTERLVLENLKR